MTKEKVADLLATGYEVVRLHIENAPHCKVGGGAVWVLGVVDWVWNVGGRLNASA